MLRKISGCRKKYCWLYHQPSPA